MTYYYMARKIAETVSNLTYMRVYNIKITERHVLAKVQSLEMLERIYRGLLKK